MNEKITKWLRNVSYLLTFLIIFILSFNLPLLNINVSETQFFNQYRLAALSNICICLPILVNFTIYLLVKNKKILEIIELSLTSLTLFIYFVIYYKKITTLSFNNIFIYLMYFVFIIYLSIKVFCIITVKNDNKYLIENDHLRVKTIKNNVFITIITLMFTLLISIGRAMDKDLNGGFTWYNFLLIFASIILTITSIFYFKIKVNVFSLVSFITISIIFALIGFNFQTLVSNLHNLSTCSIDGITIIISIIVLDVLLIFNNLSIMRKYCVIDEDNVLLHKNIDDVPSLFIGSHNGLFFRTLLFYIINIFSLGIAYPSALCMLERYKCNNTIISGRALKFVGSAKQLYKKWFLWLFLSYITCFIYYLFVSVDIEKFKASNTFFVDEESKKHISTYKGKYLPYVGIKLLTIVINIATLTLAKPFTKCLMNSYLYSQRVYSNRKLYFSGNGLSLFFIILGYIILSIITLSVFAWFILINYKRWEVKHIHCIIEDNTNEEELIDF